MIGDFFSLALNNLKRRRLRAWLTILGIFIGIAAVVALISLGQGLKEAVTGQFGSLSSDILTIQNAGTGFGPPGSTAIVKLNSHDLDVVKKVEGVEEVIIRLIRIVRVEYNGVADFSYVASIPESQRQTDIIYKDFDAKAQEGRLIKADDFGKVLLGSSFAKTDRYGRQINVGSRINLQGKDFQIVGILEETGNFIINSAIMIDERDLKDLLDIGDEIDLIAVRVKPGFKPEDVAKAIEDALRKDRKEKLGEEDFQVQTPLQAISTVSTILTVINTIVAGIAAIYLIVGGIGIANTMYTSVLERTKEIGTMKAVGARNSDILKVFLIESGFLGLIGGIIGVVIGIGMSFAVSAIANAAFGSTILKFQLNFYLIFGALAFSFLIGSIAGFMPARQAYKLNPVEALRS